MTATWTGLMVAALVAAPAVAAGPDGAALFQQNCSACHQAQGEGVEGAFPKLQGNAFVQGNEALVASTILKGRGGMPSFSADLTDEQIAAILTHVRSSWGNHAPAITPATVAAARAGSATEQKSVLPGH